MKIQIVWHRTVFHLSISLRPFVLGAQAQFSSTCRKSNLHYQQGAPMKIYPWCYRGRSFILLASLWCPSYNNTTSHIKMDSCMWTCKIVNKRVQCSNWDMGVMLRLIYILVLLFAKPVTSQMLYVSMYWVHWFKSWTTRYTTYYGGCTLLRVAALLSLV